MSWMQINYWTFPQSHRQSSSQTTPTVRYPLLRSQFNMLDMPARQELISYHFFSSFSFSRQPLRPLIQCEMESGSITSYTFVSSLASNHAFATLQLLVTPLTEKPLLSKYSCVKTYRLTSSSLSCRMVQEYGQSRAYFLLSDR